MRFFRTSLVVIFIFFFSAGSSSADSGTDRPVPESLTEATVNPISFSENSVTAGKQIFDRSCVTCHGEDGKGDPSMIGMLEADPPDLTDGVWKLGDSDGAIYGVIQKGTKTGMEPFAGKLNERQTWNVVNYLRSIAEDAGSTVTEATPTATLTNPIESTTDSISTGKQYYVRGCVECHGMDGRGHTEMVEFLVERPANLRKDTWKYGTADAGVFRIIREGTPNDMPAFNEKLTEEQTWHVVNYLGSIRGKD